MENFMEINKEDLAFPKQLLKIKNPPKKIYVKGDYKLLYKKSIAIVGSRKRSKYGEEQAYRFAEELSKQDICVVSGLAIGIDTFAHLGSYKNIGKTIAVLGSGFNKVYPEENIELVQKILENRGLYYF